VPFALIGRLTAAVDPVPSPSPTARVLEDWEVTPGLAGFLATFGVALAAVLLFLSLSRHMRKANAYARAHGIEVPERKGIAFRREELPVDDPTSPDVASSDVTSPDVASPDPGTDGAGSSGTRPPASS
jgi:hypothetical protein